MSGDLQIRVLSQTDIRAALSYEDCIGAVRAAMIETSAGNVALPLRHAMPLPSGRGMLGMMYGYLGSPEAFGIKLASFFPGNSPLGLSTHMGLMTLFEAQNGKPIAILNGGAITAIRTAAASAVATAQLARRDAVVLAILGTGEQAAAHIQAIPLVRGLREIRIWGRDPERLRSFIDRHQPLTQLSLQASASPDAAVAGADIVCTVTGAKDPILSGRAVEAGTHLNLVGSSVADKAEVDTDLLLKARYFVDYRPSAFAQAGELARALKAGAVTEDLVLGEIGQLLTGAVEGRKSDSDITIYKSLGVASQDLAAALIAVKTAERNNIGQCVAL